ncbi:glycosyl transferase [Microstroma glucosiphilum]|uniref:Glycosyl transferase n=1 Tax=Pseudomicrostroma glucosiphilum TaxID=1684307 RepID=A0A316UFE6_9BASI|nr:glycosyl transferase [Pseudomicrostroma glucosiphilum]PWN22613.1 glycosyl transferase [Pseudomicrostroma glucosiphilum]
MLRGRRKSLLLLVLLCLFLIGLEARHHWQEVKDTLSYSTRPLWDRADGPTDIIPRLHEESLAPDSAEACQRHGWTLRPTKPLLVDVVLFSTEVELFEIRLRELSDVVDIFVVVESTHDLMGRERNLTFANRRGAFSQWESRLRYHLHQGRERTESDGFFRLVNELRGGVTAFLRDEVQPPEGSLILMADVDEIPSRATMKLLKACTAPLPIHLQMQNYIYSFEWVTDARSWRAQVHLYGEDFSYIHGKASEVAIADAGWHCSFCFRTLEEFVIKMRGASHANRLYDRADWQAMLSASRIQNKICSGQDIFDMLPEAYTWNELIRLWKGATKSSSAAHLPAAVIEQHERFAFLLPGGCLRAQQASGKPRRKGKPLDHDWSST